MNPPSMHNCPHCGADLSIQDINVSTDVALCRACGQSFPFSELVRKHEDSATLDTPPPRIKVMASPHGLEMEYLMPKAIGIFFLIFAIIWNFVILTIFIAVMPPLFAIPFILAGFGIGIAAIYMLFGRFILTLQPGMGELYRGVGGIGPRRRFRLDKNAKISIRTTTSGKDNRIVHEIVVSQPGGSSFKFGSGIHEDESRDYIVTLLRSMRQ